MKSSGRSTGETQTLSLWKLTDVLRQMRNTKSKDAMYQTNEREYRYEERNGDYLLKCWWNGVETVLRGRIDERPEWVVKIIDMAIVGGYLKRMVSPPPDAIVWFTTDLENNLTTFLELT